MAFDCEGDAAEFRGCAFVFERDGILWQQFYTRRDEAIEAFGKLAAEGFTAIAHNAGYDVAVLFPQPFPPELQINTLGTHFLNAKWMNMEIWDSYGLAPQPLAEIGVAMDLPKLGSGQAVHTMTGRQLSEYCLRDAEIVWRLTAVYQAWCQEKEIPFSSRVGALAVNYWAKTAIVPLPRSTPADREWGQSALYAGRAEVWQEGEHPHVTILDVNSMYPYAMLSGVPDPRTGYHLSGANFINDIGFYRVKVHVPAGAGPVLPWRAPDGQVYYPTGDWEGTYTSTELSLAACQGAEYELIDAYVYGRMMQPFTQFVGPLYEERLQARAAGDTTRALVTKRVLNALWGRFAMKPGSASTIMRRETWEPKKCGQCRQCRAGGACSRLHGLRRDGAYWVKPRYLGPTPDYVNDAWAAWITSTARCYLYDLMQEAGFENVIRVHTDSLTVTNAGRQRLKNVMHPTKLGRLKVEYEGAYRAIHPNITWRQDGSRVAGVPRSQADEFLEMGETEVRYPRGLIEGLGSNQIAYWQSMTVSLNGIKPSRADGGKRPWRVEELQESCAP